MQGGAPGLAARLTAKGLLPGFLLAVGCWTYMWLQQQGTHTGQHEHGDAGQAGAAAAGQVGTALRSRRYPGNAAVAAANALPPIPHFTKGRSPDDPSQAACLYR